MNSENILIYASASILFLLAIICTLFNLDEISNLFSRNKAKHFDAGRIPAFIYTLAGFVIVLTIFALVITRDISLVLQFVLGNTFFIAVGLVTLILYRRVKR